MPRGISMVKWMVVLENTFTDEGWCKVDHQSTENFIIGIFINPNIAINEVILVT